MKGLRKPLAMMVSVLDEHHSKTIFCWFYIRVKYMKVSFDI
jgi:hypothetical protein